MSDGGSEGYGRIPRWIGDAALAELSRPEMGVLIVLALHADPDGVAWPSVPRIAAMAGLSESSAYGGVKGLVERGIIERIRSGGGRGRSNVYLIVGLGERTGNPRKRRRVSDRNPPGATRKPSRKSAQTLSGGGGEQREQREQATPAPDAPALKRRRPAWLHTHPEREGRLRLIEHALRRLDGGEDALRRGGSIVAMVEAGILTPEELDTDPREVARLILDRIAARGGASVRDGA